MPASRRSWIAAAGTATAAAGGLWAALGPAQAVAGPLGLPWVGWLAFLAAIAILVGTALVLSGRVTAGAGTALVAGVVLTGTGALAAGLAAVTGATLVYGAGTRPALPDLEALTSWTTR